MFTEVERLRQEDGKFKDSLCYIVRPYLKKRSKQSWVWWLMSILPAFGKLRVTSLAYTIRAG